MKRRCERLRERAWRDGLDSRADHAWRIHCNSCPQCRTDLFLFDTLHRQATYERQHLGQAELKRLVLAARRQYAPTPKTVSLNVWALRAASLVAAFMLFALLREHHTGTTTAARPTPAPTGAAVVPLSAGQHQQPDVANLQQTVPAALPSPHSEALAWPASSSGETIETRLQELRSRIGTRRQGLLDLLESDLGEDERSREDVWDGRLLESVSALA